MSTHIRQPTCAEAAAMLTAASAVDVETDRGETIELWTISHEGDTVAASGPRLAVAAGMRVRCRIAHGDVPVHVSAVIESAEFRSQTRASLVLRVLEAVADGYERRAQRLELNASAVLRASVCDRVVPGETIAVRLSDLSESGVGLVVHDDRLRPGDRLWLAARFFEGEVLGEVRVAHVRNAPTPGALVVGCSFIDPGAVSVVVSRLLARLGGSAAREAGGGPIRAALGLDPPGCNR